MLFIFNGILTRSHALRVYPPCCLTLMHGTGGLFARQIASYVVNCAAQ